MSRSMVFVVNVLRTIGTFACSTNLNGSPKHSLAHAAGYCFRGTFTTAWTVCYGLNRTQ